MAESHFHKLLSILPQYGIIHSAEVPACKLGQSRCSRAPQPMHYWMVQRDRCASPCQHSFTGPGWRSKWDWGLCTLPNSIRSLYAVGSWRVAHPRIAMEGRANTRFRISLSTIGVFVAPQSRITVSARSSSSGQHRCQLG